MIKKVIAALFCAMLLARPAVAVDEEQVLRCVLREILASLTCKTVEDFRFVGKRDEVYVFNAHFAAKNTEFYCQVFDRDVVVTSKAWQGFMASARLKLDTQSGCILASVNSPVTECRAKRTVQCCGTD